MRGLHLNGGDYLEADRVVMAIGHSARDTFAMLRDAGVQTIVVDPEATATRAA